jgi:hypothetical protein
MTLHWRNALIVAAGAISGSAVIFAVFPRLWWLIYVWALTWGVVTAFKWCIWRSE